MLAYGQPIVHLPAFVLNAKEKAKRSNPCLDLCEVKVRVFGRHETTTARSTAVLSGAMPAD